MPNAVNEDVQAYQLATAYFNPVTLASLAMRQPACRGELNSPELTYVRGHLARIVRAYTTAPNEAERDRVTLEAADLRGLLVNVVIPLLGPTAGQSEAQFALKENFREIADSLGVIARAAIHVEAYWPEDGGRQLLLDRIDELSLKLEQVLNRREAKAACRKAAEIFVLNQPMERGPS